MIGTEFIAWVWPAGIREMAHAKLCRSMYFSMRVN